MLACAWGTSRSLSLNTYKSLPETSLINRMFMQLSENTHIVYDKEHATPRTQHLYYCCYSLNTSKYINLGN